jgi:murein DD-endopeptidase MepM/ murein hydrolase activator NlpD
MLFQGQNKRLITCDFGIVRNFGAYIPNLKHEGDDLAGEKGVTPNLAEIPGIVGIVANWKDTYGNVVITQTDMGHYSKDLEGEVLEALYGHNFSTNVKIGDHVEKGNQIGLVGNSGYCMKLVNGNWVRITEVEQFMIGFTSGTHLHLTFRTHSGKVVKWFETMHPGCSINQWGRFYLDPKVVINYI